MYYIFGNLHRAPLVKSKVVLHSLTLTQAVESGCDCLMFLATKHQIALQHLHFSLVSAGGMSAVPCGPKKIRGE